MIGSERAPRARQLAARWIELTASRPQVLEQACTYQRFRALARRWGRLGRSQFAPSCAWPPAAVLEFLEHFAPLQADPLEKARDARRTFDPTVPF